MGKFQYFDALESLSASVLEAVRLCSAGNVSKEKDGIDVLRHTCDQSVCDLESALFSDFLPPLERESIAACAHAFSRVLDRAAELFSITQNSHRVGLSNEEADICLRLSEELHENTKRLRTIRKPSEIPSLQEFRRLLAEGRAAHRAVAARLSANVRSTPSSIILWGKLRRELGYAFDQLVEVMLKNI